MGKAAESGLCERREVNHGREARIRQVCRCGPCRESPPKRERGTTSPIVSFGERDVTWQVLLVRDGRTQLRTVGVGLMNDEQVQILEGLTAEDLVIARPTQDITDNMPMRIRRE
ncbi:MAG: hypothetical protein GXY44_03265 [Phycisphaerales bacterium]|nr:hypothetical protein [Phycisphaerales bacterium]